MDEISGLIRKYILKINEISNEAEQSGDPRYVNDANRLFSEAEFLIDDFQKHEDQYDTEGFFGALDRMIANFQRHYSRSAVAKIINKIDYIVEKSKSIFRKKIDLVKLDSLEESVIDELYSICKESYKIFNSDKSEDQIVALLSPKKKRFNEIMKSLNTDLQEKKAWIEELDKIYLKLASKKMVKEAKTILDMMEKLAYFPVEPDVDYETFDYTDDELAQVERERRRLPGDLNHMKPQHELHPTINYSGEPINYSGEPIDYFNYEKFDDEDDFEIDHDPHDDFEVKLDNHLRK